MRNILALGTAVLAVAFTANAHAQCGCGGTTSYAAPVYSAPSYVGHNSGCYTGCSTPSYNGGCYTNSCNSGCYTNTCNSRRVFARRCNTGCNTGCYTSTCNSGCNTGCHTGYANNCNTGCYTGGCGSVATSCGGCNNHAYVSTTGCGCGGNMYTNSGCGCGTMGVVSGGTVTSGCPGCVGGQMIMNGAAPVEAGSPSDQGTIIEPNTDNAPPTPDDT